MILIQAVSSVRVLHIAGHQHGGTEGVQLPLPCSFCCTSTADKVFVAAVTEVLRDRQDAECVSVRVSEELLNHGQCKPVVSWVKG